MTALAVISGKFVISAAQDHCVNLAPALSFARALHAKVMLLNDDIGHQSPGAEMSRISPAIDAFLSDREALIGARWPGRPKGRPVKTIRASW